MRHALLSLLLTGSTVLTLCSLAADGQAQPAKGDASKLKRVYSVGDVTVKSGEQLTVEARGVARTGGWKNAQLRPVKGAGGEGILELEFVAQPPDGMASQAFSPVSASYQGPKPDGFKVVRVLAETNDKTGK